MNSTRTRGTASTEEDSIQLGWTQGSAPGVGFNLPSRATFSPEPVWFDGPHMLTVAPSGAGKAVSAAIPTLLNYPGQVIALDVKGELYHVTARRRREMGHRVIRLDPFRVIAEGTDSLNPVDILKLPNADLDTDCQSIAKLLAVGTSTSKDPFWELSANALNSGVLAYIAGCEPGEKQNLPRLVDLIHGDDVSYNLAVLLDTKGKQMPKLAYQELAAFLQLPERETRPSTLATAQSFVKTLNSARVAESLENSTVSLTDLRDGAPLSIYVVIPPDRLNSHAAIVSLWVGTMLQTIFSRRTAPALRTLMLLDEAAALGSFAMLETAITLCRSYGVRVWTFWQDLQQIQSCYPSSWRTLLNNCSVQVFGLTSRLMAQELASVLDCSVGDLLSLGPTEQLLQLVGHRPMRTERLNYLHDPEFLGLFDANPFHAARRTPPRRLTGPANVADRHTRDENGQPRCAG
ncbi:MAG: type IV secretory system conjugative DNA transfer family protein [Planctomycetota bacterium]|nr:type IV secretory system conjugative DNA transfer family protein [Planctomycetota bacterium]